MFHLVGTDSLLTILGGQLLSFMRFIKNRYTRLRCLKCANYRMFQLNHPQRSNHVFLKVILNRLFELKLFWELRVRMSKIEECICWANFVLSLSVICDCLSQLGCALSVAFRTHGFILEVFVSARVQAFTSCWTYFLRHYFRQDILRFYVVMHSWAPILEIARAPIFLRPIYSLAKALCWKCEVAIPIIHYILVWDYTFKKVLVADTETFRINLVLFRISLIIWTKRHLSFSSNAQKCRISLLHRKFWNQHQLAIHWNIIEISVGDSTIAP